MSTIIHIHLHSTRAKHNPHNLACVRWLRCTRWNALRCEIPRLILIYSFVATNDKNRARGIGVSTRGLRSSTCIHACHTKRRAHRCAGAHCHAFLDALGLAHAVRDCVRQCNLRVSTCIDHAIELSTFIRLDSNVWFVSTFHRNTARLSTT